MTGEDADSNACTLWRSPTGRNLFARVKFAIPGGWRLPIQSKDRVRNLADGMTVDTSLVDRIVQGVLQQMQAPAAVGVTTAVAAPKAATPVVARPGVDHR